MMKLKHCHMCRQEICFVLELELGHGNGQFVKVTSAACAKDKDIRMLKKETELSVVQDRLGRTLNFGRIDDRTAQV